jgi:hypothetical protein
VGIPKNLTSLKAHRLKGQFLAKLSPEQRLAIKRHLLRPDEQPQAHADLWAAQTRRELYMSVNLNRTTARVAPIEGAGAPDEQQQQQQQQQQEEEVGIDEAGIAASDDPLSLTQVVMGRDGNGQAPIRSLVPPDVVLSLSGTLQHTSSTLRAQELPPGYEQVQEDTGLDMRRIDLDGSTQQRGS